MTHGTQEDQAEGTGASTAIETAFETFNVFGELMVLDTKKTSMSDLPSAATLAKATMRIVLSDRHALWLDLLDVINDGTLSRREVLWLAAIGLKDCLENTENRAGGEA